MAKISFSTKKPSFSTKSASLVTNFVFFPQIICGQISRVVGFCGPWRIMSRVSQYENPWHDWIRTSKIAASSPETLFCVKYFFSVFPFFIFFSSSLSSGLTQGFTGRLTYSFS